MSGESLKTLLFTDVVGSTEVARRLGDRAAAEAFARLDRVARDVLAAHGGCEFDRTDGFFFLFDRPADAVRCALALHDATARAVAADAALEPLRREGIALAARAGIHLGELLLRENAPADVARGARPVECEGLAISICARVMSLATGGQTLMTRGAFDLARRGAVGDEDFGAEVGWLAHGPYLFKGIDEPMDVFEVGVRGRTPMAAPPNSEKAVRAVAPGDDATLGWRPAAGLLVPQRPHWRLVERLGEGGYGEVWLAEHAKTRDRHVFKFCFDVNRLRGLKREVTLFRLLKETLGDRDDIARVLDWNFDDAPYFIESEHTGGGSLVDWAEAQGGIAAISLATRLELIAQVSEALGAAHSVGVLHKDIKPSNVLVVQDRNGEPRARLTDFGIGIITDHERLAQAGVTAAGMTASLLVENDSSRTGTRLYMAPELLEGKPATIQSDIFALGVMLFQAVTAEFRRALPSDWRDEVEDQLLADDIAACIVGDPRKRLASAETLAERLRTLGARRAERARAQRDAAEAAAGRDALDRARRRRKLVVLGSTGLTVLCLLLGSLYIRAEGASRRERDARDIAEIERDNARRAEATVRAREADLERQLYFSSVILAGVQFRQGNLKTAWETLLSAPEHHRNWEWYDLAARTHPLLMSAPVPANRIACTADETRILAMQWGKSIVLLDADTGRVIATLAADGGFVAQFSPEGRRILTASRDGIARIWNAGDGSLILEFAAREKDLRAAAFDPAGRRVACAFGEADACLFDAATGERLLMLTGHEETIRSVAWSPDGARLITASQDGTARIWDSVGGAKLGTLRTPWPREKGRSTDHTHWVSDASFSPDGRRILTEHFDGRSGSHAIFWDAATFAMQFAIEDAIRLSMSRDWSRAAALGGKVFRVWDVEKSATVSTSGLHPGFLRSVDFSPDTTRAISGADDGIVRLWDTASGLELEAIGADSRAVNAAVFSPSGNFLIIGGSSGLRTQLASKRQSAVPLEDSDVLGFAQTSPDGRHVVHRIANRNDEIHVWDATTGRKSAILKGHTEIISDISFSADGKRLATASYDRTARVWDTESWTCLQVLKGHGGALFDANFNHDGTVCATDATDGTVRFWDVATGLEQRVLDFTEDSPPGDQNLPRVHWSPDGSSVVIVRDNGIIDVWNPADGTRVKELQTVSARTEPYVLFNADGSILLTKAEELQLWEPADGWSPRGVLPDSTNARSGEFDRDGRRLAATFSDGTIRIWDTATLVQLHSFNASKGSLGPSFSMGGDRLFLLDWSDGTGWGVWDINAGRELAHHSSPVFRLSRQDDTRILTHEEASGWTVDWINPLGARPDMATWREVPALGAEGLPALWQFRRRLWYERSRLPRSHAACSRAEALPVRKLAQSGVFALLVEHRVGPLETKGDDGLLDALVDAMGSDIAAACAQISDDALNSLAWGAVEEESVTPGDAIAACEALRRCEKRRALADVYYRCDTLAACVDRLGGRELAGQLQRRSWAARHVLGAALSNSDFVADIQHQASMLARYAAEAPSGPDPSLVRTAKGFSAGHQPAWLDPTSTHSVRDQAPTIEAYQEAVAANNAAAWEYLDSVAPLPDLAQMTDTFMARLEPPRDVTVGDIVGPILDRVERVIYHGLTWEERRMELLLKFQELYPAFASDLAEIAAQEAGESRTPDSGEGGVSAHGVGTP